MDKLELCGWESDALIGLLGEVLAEDAVSARNAVVLQGIYNRLTGSSARGKTVTVSLSHSVVFEGDVLEEYLEQLDDYEDTPSQREWFVLDQLFSSENIDQLKLVTNLSVSEK